MTTIWNPHPPEDLSVEMSLIGKRSLSHFDAATFRRSAFDKAGYFSELWLSQDTLLRMQMAARCRLAGGKTREPVAMRGVHSDNRIQHPERMLAAQQAVFAALLEWAPSADLTRPQLMALYQAHLRHCWSWTAVRQAIGRYPRMLLHPQTYINILRWIIFRRFPHDSHFPGPFPGFRMNIARRFNPLFRPPSS